MILLYSSSSLELYVPSVAKVYIETGSHNHGDDCFANHQGTLKT